MAVDLLEMEPVADVEVLRGDFLDAALQTRLEAALGGQADLVVAGCAILDAVHRLWPVDRLRVADRGLREGILGQLMGHNLRQALLLGADHLPPAA